MGTLWVAHSEKLKTDVVVKLLSDALAPDANARERFSREVVSTSHVRSPHVVSILDHGITEQRIPFMVMELLEGKDLAKTLLDRGRLNADEVLHIVEGVASALAQAHERSVIHRDVKPANIFLCSGEPRPFVKLVDFGIAKNLVESSITKTHAQMGTPGYMSPEQVLGGGPIDHRADLWALGVIAFHALTGRLPFRTPSAVIGGEAPSITSLRADLPAELDAFFARALARAPAERFASAGEMSAAFAKALATPRPVVTTPPVFFPTPRPSGPPPPPPYLPPPVYLAPLPPRKGSYGAAIALVLVALVLAAGVVAGVLFKRTPFPHRTTKSVRTGL
jgi:eukaryotic-like serine/threonine-protein kinase